MGLGATLWAQQRFGMPTSLPDTELAAVADVLFKAYNLMASSGWKYTVAHVDPLDPYKSSCVTCSEARSRDFVSSLPSSSWAISSVSLIGGAHTFNLLVYKGSDNIEVHWEMDNYLRIAEVYYWATGYPRLTSPCLGNNTYYGDRRVKSIDLPSYAGQYF